MRKKRVENLKNEELWIEYGWEFDEDPDLSHLGKMKKRLLSEDRVFIDCDTGELFHRDKTSGKQEFVCTTQASIFQFSKGQYWCPGNDHLSSDNWNHVSEESKAKVLEKHGSLLDAGINYTLEDLKRYDNFHKGRWHMMRCTVSVYATIRVSQYHIQKVRLGSGSLWGIESDSDESYFNEVETDLRSGALSVALKVLNYSANLLPVLEAAEINSDMEAQSKQLV